MAREPLELVIDSLDAEGRGVARKADGKVVFVEGALAGERVLAESVRSKSTYEQARTIRILKASSERREPLCRHFEHCGGCVTQYAQVRAQVAAKQRWLEETFARIGEVSPGVLLPPLYGMEWGYRHRARLTVRHVAKKGGALVGFHERRSSYVVDMDSCEVLTPAVSALLVPLRGLIDSLSLRARIPQIEIAVGDEITALVIRNLDATTAEDDVQLRRFADETGTWIWLQPGGPDSAYPFHPASGPRLDYVLPEFDLRLAFAPTEFTQVNHAVNRALVSRAMRLLDPRPGERIADLFCGLGNFSLPIARLGATVHGVEGSETLVRRARENAAANGLSARAGFSVANLFSEEDASLANLGHFDKLLIDPPRDGALEVIKALPEDGPARIVYISCHPATLARDAGVLVNVKGYRLGAAGVVNMFPHTAHVESMAVFERVRPGN